MEIQSEIEEFCPNLNKTFQDWRVCGSKHMTFVC